MVKSLFILENWCRQTDSNRQSSLYKSAAVPLCYAGRQDVLYILPITTSNNPATTRVVKSDGFLGV